MIIDILPLHTRFPFSIIASTQISGAWRNGDGPKGLIELSLEQLRGPKASVSIPRSAPPQFNIEYGIILDRLDDVIFIIDKDGTILFVNKEALIWRTAAPPASPATRTTIRLPTVGRSTFSLAAAQYISTDRNPFMPERSRGRPRPRMRSWGLASSEPNTALYTPFGGPYATDA